MEQWWNCRSPFFVELESQAHYLKYLFYFIPDCGTGYFGAQCANLCSEHCAGIDNSCNNVNGTCNMGCDPGYKGSLCTQGEFKRFLVQISCILAGYYHKLYTLIILNMTLFL